GTTLSFTSHTAQTVTVHTLDDSTAEGAEVFVFSAAAATGADGEASVAGSPQAVTIFSSDQALSVTCTAAAGHGDLTEGTALTVANCAHGNTEALVADVLVQWAIYDNHGVAVADVGTATATAATDFSPNRGTLTIPMGHTSSQTVPLQLTATDDHTEEMAEEFSLVITTAADTDGRYVSEDVDATQNITVAASEAAAITLEDGDSTNPMAITTLEVTEESATRVSYTVQLAQNPTVDATVRVSATGSVLRFYNAATGGSAEETLDLTFTTANWNTAQTVYVTAGNDDDGLPSAATIAHTTSAASGPYQASNNISTGLAVTIPDDDVLTFTLMSAATEGFGSNLVAAEGGDTPTFTVAISVQPPASTPVTVSIASDIGTQTSGVTATFSPSTLEFTNANWDEDQSVVTTIAGVDSNAVVETITITVTATSVTTAYSQTPTPGTFTFRLTEPAAFFWTVRARGGGDGEVDTNEGAQALPNFNTADPGEMPQPGENRDGTPDTGNAEDLAADWMYFRFTAVTDSGGGTDNNDDYPHTPVTVHYCLGGSATGGTTADANRDYTYPSGYDATATTPTDSGARSCTGRGSFTTGTGDADNIYRLPITLNDDSVIEADETITATVVAVTSADGHARLYSAPSSEPFVATRTIKDNEERALVSIAPGESSALEGDT
ncbi:MAG: hypothetical protein OXU78_04815, partial [Deltaproteobacteria bacterium]|nr:hypothetical protein [Deltaproteobacteria bacterium]